MNMRVYTAGEYDVARSRVQTYVHDYQWPHTLTSTGQGITVGAQENTYTYGETSEWFGSKCYLFGTNNTALTLTTQSEWYEAVCDDASLQSATNFSYVSNTGIKYSDYATKKFKVLVSVNSSPTIALASFTTQACIALNGDPIAKSITEYISYYSTSTMEQFMCCIASLSYNDVVSIQFRNTVAGGTQILLRRINITISEV